MEIQSTADNNGLCQGSKMYGKVTYKAFDKDGNLVDTKTVSNNIVLGVRLPIIKLLAGYQAGESTSTAPTIAQALPFVKYIQLGEDATAPTATDVGVHKVIDGSYKETTSIPQVNEDGPSVTFAFMYPASFPLIEDYIIREMGLYTKDGTMIARTVVGEWKKIPGLYFEIYWTIGYAQSNN